MAGALAWRQLAEIERFSSLPPLDFAFRLDLVAKLAIRLNKSVLRSCGNGQDRIRFSFLPSKIAAGADFARSSAVCANVIQGK